jgi:hypothetical protein
VMRELVTVYLGMELVLAIVAIAILLVASH